eukprot:TRINITY_DN3998_c0_g1_i3.p1 TRINITY_DN3998_c0_g1~~TRINITY_DN3998_c0_g1_i3.p1  ORF type:complete len:177 (+),score=11.31 TRINITY_DN3998_c0_g1_i3:234-764(+)
MTTSLSPPSPSPTSLPSTSSTPPHHTLTICPSLSPSPYFLQPKFEQHHFVFDLPLELTQDHHPHLLFELLTIDLNSNSNGAQVYAQSRFDLPASKLTDGYKYHIPLFSSLCFLKNNPFLTKDVFFSPDRAILNVPLQTFDTKAVVGSVTTHTIPSCDEIQSIVFFLSSTLHSRRIF